MLPYTRPLMSVVPFTVEKSESVARGRDVSGVCRGPVS